MKASDIPDEAFLSAVVKCGADNPARWAFWWDVTEELKVYPDKVVLAKARKLLKRGLIGGCVCGCRGDWVVRGNLGPEFYEGWREVELIIYPDRTPELYLEWVRARLNCAGLRTSRRLSVGYGPNDTTGAPG